MSRKKDRYVEPVTMTVRNALGMEEEKFSEKQLRRLLPDQESLISEHRSDLEELKKVEDRIEKAVMDYEKNDEDREPLEKVYDQKLRILYSMAGRFHPLSSYGRSMLKKARACRREFEASVGPLMTVITKNNIDLFRTVLSKDLCEDVLSGRRMALGAVRTRKGKTYGAAAISYYLDRVPSYDGPVLRIEWLYVHEKFRGCGQAVNLLGEVLAQAAELQVAAISAEFEAEGESNYILGYMLGTLQFDLDTDLDPVALIRIGDITGHTKLASGKKGAEQAPFEDEKNGALFLKKAFRRLGYNGYMKKLPVSWFDGETSCFTGTPENVSGLLLSHKMPSGILRAEYEGLTGNRDDVALKLVSLFLAKATLVCDDDTIVMIPVESEEMGHYLESICSGQMGRYMVEGILDRPERDVDESAVNELMK
jgi:GNAT superfamily N-acetyltransferase